MGREIIINILCETFLLNYRSLFYSTCHEWRNIDLVFVIDYKGWQKIVFNI